MSRYVNTIQTALTADEAQAIINGYLQGEGFQYRLERSEMVWRKGMGALANPQFIKAEPGAGGLVRIEAWTAGASLVPGVYGGELNPMEGVWGFGPKLALKPRVHELERRLGGTPMPAQATVAVPAAWYPDPTGRHQQRYWDGARWTDNVADGGQQAVDPAGVA
jgi:hypothetical protein